MSILFSDNEGGGGGGIRPYPPGQRIFPRFPDRPAGSAISTGRDYLVPFRPRADVTITHISWLRSATTAGTAYLSVIDEAGSRISDAVEDADTLEGIHDVEITSLDIPAEQKVYFVVNQSAAIVCSENPQSAADQQFVSNVRMATKYFEEEGVSLDLYVGGSAPTSRLNRWYGAPYKSRSAAAQPATQTMTGWTWSDEIIALGGKAAP